MRDVLRKAARMTKVGAAVAIALAGTWPTISLAAKPAEVTFALHVDPPFLACLAKSRATPPKVTAKVVRGELNDVLTLTLTGFKPKLDFDLFTVEKSNLLANGSVDPNFKNFGMAWYQSDVHTNASGDGSVRIQTILLDQIFGFDPNKNLAPTNTFHIGFWFNRPQDAAPCGFTGFTPFNGEHHAGPVAFITVPNAKTHLGPLCSDPNTSTNPAHCNP